LPWITISVVTVQNARRPGVFPVPPSTARSRALSEGSNVWSSKIGIRVLAAMMLQQRVRGGSDRSFPSFSSNAVVTTNVVLPVDFESTDIGRADTHTRVGRWDAAFEIDAVSSPRIQCAVSRLVNAWVKVARPCLERRTEHLGPGSPSRCSQSGPAASSTKLSIPEKVPDGYVRH